MKKIICTILLSVSVFTASAQKFQQVLESIVSSSPEMKAMEFANGAETEALAQENILAGPEIEGSHQWGNKGERKYGGGISQSFDWPGLYGARAKARKANTDALMQLQKSALADLTLEVKLLMIEFITTNEQLRAVSEASSNMNKLLELYQRGFKAGEESILDVNKLKIEHLRLSRRVTQLQEERDALLESIMGKAGSESVSDDLLSMTLNDLPADPIADEAEYERIIDQSAKMQYMRSMQEATRMTGRVARLSGMPTFSLGYSMEHEDGQYFNGISVNIGLPSWSNKHRKATAEYQLLEQEVKMDAERLAQVLKMRRLRTSAQRARTEQEMFREVLESTNQAELLMKALKGQHITLMTYLQELNYFLDATCDYYDIVNNAAQLCAELNKYNN